MAENIQKIKTRYPFGGFYLELLPEAERKDLESIQKQVKASYAMIKKMMNKWEKLSVPAKATICYTICSLLQKGISFIVVPIFTRVLPTAEYGMYSVYQSIQSVVSIVVTLNLGAATFNVCAKKCTEKQRGGMAVSLMGLSMVMVTIGYIVWYCINLFTAGALNRALGLSNELAGLMFLQIGVAALTGIWSAGMRYSFSYRPLVLYTIVLAILNPIISLVAFSYFGAFAKVRIISVVALEVLVGMVVCLSFAFKNWQSISIRWWKFATKFSFPLVPHYLSMTVLNQADRIMISTYIGNTEAAIYSVAYNVGIIINFFTTSINSAFIPFVYESLKKERYKEIRKYSEELLLFVGVLVVGVVALAPEIMKILAPEEYYEAVWIIPPVALSSFFIFAYSLFANIEFYFEQNKYVMVASCTGAIANVVLNAIFIPIFGYIVAGYTTLFCYVLFVILHYIFYKKTIKLAKLKVDIFDVRKMMALCVVLIITVVLLNFCYKIAVLRFGIVGCILITVFLNKNAVIKYIEKIKK